MVENNKQYETIGKLHIMPSDPRWKKMEEGKVVLVYNNGCWHLAVECDTDD